MTTAIQTTGTGLTATFRPLVSGPGRDAEESRFGAVPRGGIRDRVSLSSAARGLFEEAKEADESSGPADPEQLSEEEKKEVAELKARDREVRAHEQAHVAALGGEGGSASFSFTTGPDGRQYATGGEVPISISEVAGNPDATIQRARKIAAAALAPAQPSGADVKAAAKARELEAKARRDLTEKKNGTDDEDPGTTEGAPVDAGIGAAADLVSTAGAALGSGGARDDHQHAPGEHCAVCGT